MIKLTYVGVLLLALCSCQKRESNTQDYKTICAEFDQVDREMLDLIKRIQNKHLGNQKFISNFTMEQVYWTQYRDHHLKTMYPKDWSRYYRKEFGKEVFNLCKCQEMIRFTKNRIKELTFWTKGGLADQLDCPSLMNQ